MANSCGGLGEREGTLRNRRGDVFQDLGGDRLRRAGIGNQPVHPGIGFDGDAKRGERETLEVSLSARASSCVAPG